MKQIYNSDQPLRSKSQDRFNRQKFSSRIAETIINRSIENGLVIGLYGVWGEGKSSILNMIEEDLKVAESILLVKFNPWRFKDEETLIFNFLKNLSEGLDRELTTKKERFGKFLKDYGSLGSVIGVDVSKIGETLSDTKLEELKNRVNDFLREGQKKVVVVIDDIDRLDKQELFSLFKLIKLTGDFLNTYYVLSFDDKMVASAIGERFAEGNAESGYNFLEKIIQVPIRIPQARQKDLLQFTVDLTNSILNDNGIELDENESKTTGAMIAQNLLPRIKTPRLAIRFTNSLSFIIPLLNGEVNISDLILLEGIKILYTHHYDFIKSFPDFFIKSYNATYSRTRDDNKVKEFKEKFDELNSQLSKGEKQSILNLIIHLFPYVREATENYSYGYGDISWVKEKRVVAEKYFYRYFTYGVAKDDISDIRFNQYLKGLKITSWSDIVEITGDILSNIEPIEFVSKLTTHEESLDWDSKHILIKLICHYQDRFEGMSGGTMLLSYYPKSQAAIIVCRLIRSLPNRTDRLELSKGLMGANVDFEFSKEILRWLDVGRENNEKVLETSQLRPLKKLLLERAIKESTINNSNIFELYNSQVYFLIQIWLDESQDELRRYVDALLDNDAKFAEVILEALTPTIYSSTRSNPYKTDFTQECYNNLKQYCNAYKVKSMVLDQYSKELENLKVVFRDLNESQTKLNVIAQFLHWYALDSKLILSH